MKLVIKTFLRTRMPDGELKTWLSNGNPCETEQGPSGYRSVTELREELKRRNKNSHIIEEIKDGLKLTPHPGYGQGYTLGRR